MNIKKTPFIFHLKWNIIFERQNYSNSSNMHSTKSNDPIIINPINSTQRIDYVTQ